MTDILDEENKRCRKCNEIKPLTEFVRQKWNKQGRGSYCRPCSRAIIREIYNRNPKKKLAQNKVWDEQHRERIKELAYIRRDKNPGKHKARVAVGNAVRVGKFTREACSECENPKTDFHHTNGYDEENWFTGVWLCRKHHHQLHKELRWTTN